MKATTPQQKEHRGKNNKHFFMLDKVLNSRLHWAVGF
jgi:hypothetical protein